MNPIDDHRIAATIRNADQAHRPDPAQARALIDEYRALPRGVRWIIGGVLRAHPAARRAGADMAKLARDTPETFAEIFTADDRELMRAFFGWRV